MARKKQNPDNTQHNDLNVETSNEIQINITQSTGVNQC